MASELQFDYGVTGKNVYFLLRNSVGKVWNGSAFVAYVTANYALYPLTAVEQGTSGFYAADVPTSLADLYSVTAKERAGGSPAETDLSVGDGDLGWSGTTVLTAAAMADALLGRNIAGGSDGTRTVTDGLRRLRNREDYGNGVVYQEDDTTVAWTYTITSSPAASTDVITAIDPN